MAALLSPGIPRAIFNISCGMTIATLHRMTPTHAPGNHAQFGELLIALLGRALLVSLVIPLLTLTGALLFGR
jgi:hypothetical protein